jgi:hypothetical protein
MKKWTVLLGMALLPWQLCAESFEEFSKGYQSEFQEYKESQNREFAEFVKKQWEEFRVFKGEKPYEKPKVDKPPVAKPVKEPVKVTTPVVTPPKIITPPAPPAAKPAPAPKPDMPQIAFGFYGSTVSVPYKKALRVRVGKPGKEGVTAALEKLTAQPHEETLKALNAHKTAMNLNDWGFFLLIRVFASRLAVGENDANMITWYLMLSAGYDTKVAYDDQNLYLFGAVSHTVYQTISLKEGAKTYYILDPKGRSQNVGALYSFKGNYPKSDRTLSYLMGDIRLPGSGKQRTLSFTYNGTPHSLNVEYNPNKVAFYERAPQTAFNLYFDAPVEHRAKKTLLSELAPLVKGRDELDAVNFLLRFVQSAFAYATDDAQFKREKPLFPEETLHYPASDCEDRSILFAYLVRNLLGLEVVALHYPGHLAAAVRFHGTVAGDSFTHKNKRFTVTDPTYVGANAGMAMPQFKSSSYKVVEMGL